MTETITYDIEGHNTSELFTRTGIGSLSQSDFSTEYPTSRNINRIYKEIIKYDNWQKKHNREVTNGNN